MGKARLSPQDRGPLGAWAWEKRHEHGWSDREVVDRLAAAGTAMRDSSYRGIEAGSYNPAPDVVAALERLYGAQAPIGAPAPAPSLRAVLDALEALDAKIVGVQASLDTLADVLTSEPSPND